MSARHRRRSRGRWAGRGWPVALGLLIVAWSSVSSASDTSTTTSTTPPTTSTSTTTTSTVPGAGDPFTSAAVVAYLSSRRGNVTAGLLDVSTGQTYLYRPRVAQETASMVKIDILADLLYEAQQAHRSLSVPEVQVATRMIEDSDNVSAQRLWNDIGGFGLSTKMAHVTGGYYAMQRFDHLLGFTGTTVDWGWGSMLTTPADFLRLLAAIWLPSPVLTAPSQDFERDLMEQVVSSQRFGIPNGVPARATVGVKNGWYPETATGWQINSAGYVHLGAVTYLAVVMAGSNPDETYGLDTVNTLGTLLWRFESRRP